MTWKDRVFFLVLLLLASLGWYQPYVQLDRPGKSVLGVFMALVTVGWAAVEVQWQREKRNRS